MPVLPEYDLTGKTAILATSGGSEAPFLGQALVEAGASVFAVARTQALLDAVLASLPSGSGGAVMDAGVPGSAEAVMEQFDRSNDKVDILVNDPRSMFAKPLEEIGVDEWDAVQTRNAKAPFLLSQQVLPRMAKAEYGRVVNMISELAERGMINGSAFSASQAAVLALTRSLAAEWVKYNIRSNAIAPGPFPTKGAWDRLFPKPISKFFNFEKTLPMKRYGNHQELANLAAYMVSDYAGYMNGEVVTLDSGEWIKNAGQFNKLDKIPKSAWGLIERAVRGKKIA